ncbi:MAG: HIT family protein [Chloroflexi bacterium]|nr:HIT family protein [Chloroflexota bacterium]
MRTPWEHQPYIRPGSRGGCVFCDIVAGKAPGTVHYQDDDVVVLSNRLQWVPVMLLVIPRRHISQEELWSSPIIARVASVALEMGARFCPGGYRLLSNFGHHAMQTQTHGHLHVLGGTQLGPYV